MTNWGTRPIQLGKGSVVANIEEVDLIAAHDSVWDEDLCPQKQATEKELYLVS